MTLSIIIVNYNVKFFLEQCLYALLRSTLTSVEIIVVDNNSSDGSIAYLEPIFPGVRFLANKKNAGFARSCNQGFAHASGEYILFLNPDTIVAEDTLSKCVSFLQTTADAGAVGVRMIDGSGKFLKESKRSFPGPMTSFFKLSGLSALFPRSRVFARYHLGHLSERSNHAVDVLAGAFMMIPAKVLHEAGTFDETFFMYGEDIDLSYRIQQKGYRNYYLAETTIIHFKGESTKRGSLNYVRMFYTAMSVFAKKHYGGARAGIFNAFIQLAIGMRAALSAAGKGISRLGLTMIDAVLILFSFWLTKEVWTSYIRTEIDYSERLLLFALPAFTFIYLLVAYYAGLYQREYRNADLFRSTGIATLTVLAIYALLPEHYRFSRGILLFGALLSLLLLSILRSLLLRAGWLAKRNMEGAHPFILIAGTSKETASVMALLNEAGRHHLVLGRIATDGDVASSLASIDSIRSTIAALNARELIICTGALHNKKAMEMIQELKNVRIRFHAAGSKSIVGSDSKGTSGEVFSNDAPPNLSQLHSQRLKRLLDVMTSLLFLLTLPVHLFFVQAPWGFIRNCWDVLTARKTWVGFVCEERSLVPLRSSILAPNGFAKADAMALPEQTKKLVDYWYAKDYQPFQDLLIIYKNYVRLGSN